MKAKEILKKMQKICDDGHGDVDVLFDSEAVAFNHHMVNIRGCYYEDEPKPHVGLTFEDADFFRRWIPNLSSEEGSQT